MMLMEAAQKTRTDEYRKYRHVPELYATEVLKMEWWSKQIEIAHSVRDNRRTAVYAGHAVGKTHLMGGLIQWHYDSFDPSITLTTAPSWESIHDLLWGEIKAQRQPEMPGRLLDMRLESGPMHYAKGHNADRGAGFQGRHEGRVFLVLDEAMGIPPYIYDAANSMMAAPECREILLGNPTEMGGPYYDAREDPAWNVINISCLEHPNILAELAGEAPPYPKAVSLTWVNEMVAKHAMPTSNPTADSFEWPPESGEWYDPDDIFRPRVLGLFPHQASTAVWSDAWLKYAREHTQIWDDRDIPELGVDVARFGDDNTVLYARRGPAVTHREEYQKQATTETTGRVIALVRAVAQMHSMDDTAIPIKVDDSGLGGGVTDQLREKGFMVVPIIAGSRARDPDAYHDMRSELWFVTAERAQKMRVDMSALPQAVYQKLAAEFRACRYKMQSDTTKRVESKSDYKKRVGRSPDDADAFNLCFYPAGGAGPGTTGRMNPQTESRVVRKQPTGSRWGRSKRTGYRRR